MTNVEGSGAPIRFGQTSGDPNSAPAFGRSGALTGVVVVALVVGALVWAAASGRPAAAQRPELFAGSVVLEDTRPLTVIDVATGQITIRLDGVNSEVGAANYGDVQPVPVSGGTMLVNQKTGAFNFLQTDNYVLDPNGPGVGLGQLPGLVGAEGLASGADAYILRSAPDTTVSLVGRNTVAEAAKAQATPTSSAAGVTASPAAAIAPLGFDAVGAPVSLQPGAAVVSGSDLWVLAGHGPGCQAVQLHPTITVRQGLVSFVRAAGTTPCSRGALEVGRGSVAVAGPGVVQLAAPAAPPGAGSSSVTGPAPATVRTAFTANSSRILPVTGVGDTFWFLASQPNGWDLFGVGADRRVVGPFALQSFDASSDPVGPVMSGGFLYTLDQAVSGQPTLWTIDPSNGHMAPLREISSYPVLAAEHNNFTGAEVLADGPRVVFNNPGNLEAVVVFTDGTHAPVVVDKSRAVTVSTTGPADLNLTTRSSVPGSKGPAVSKPQAVPVVQPVSQQVTCANTTQKPYVPQVTGVTPSSSTVLVQWSYQLLDQTDCEPDSWGVQVTALSGGHQPAHPTQVVNGQDQYTFTGLRPATQYEVTVTAYINAQSTPSAPTPFTTNARGPDAPLSVTTTADGLGDWVVSWNPCTEAVNPNCVVPAAQWTVTGARCGGTPFLGAAPSVQVAGTTDTATISAASLGELGSYVTFTVQGSLASGLAGDPTGDRSCTEAWKKPTAADITLTGAGTPDASGATVTATLTVETSGDPTTVFGAQPSETDFVYRVGGRSEGPTTATTAKFPGMPAGVTYSPSVEVYPAGHSAAAVTITGQPFSKNVLWPGSPGGPEPTVTGTVSQKDPNSGTVTASWNNLPTGPINATSTVLQCGGSGGATDSLPDRAITKGTVSYDLLDPALVTMGGSCTLTTTLVYTGSPNPYGVSDQLPAVQFELGQQPSYSFSVAVSGDCTHDGKCGPFGEPWQLTLSSSGQLDAGGQWTVVASVPNDPFDNHLCYESLNPPAPPTDFTFDLPQLCPDASKVDVTVTYEYLGQTQSLDAGNPNGGGSPATTTTSTSSTSTTLAPCPSTTTSSTDCSPTGGAAHTPLTAAEVTQAAILAAAETDSHVDHTGRAVLGWLFLALVLGSAIGLARRLATRRKNTKGTT